MSSSNYRRNKAALDAFRKDLEAEMGDLSEIDIKILNQAVNGGTQKMEQETPIGKHPNPVTFMVRRGPQAGKMVSFKARAIVGGTLKKGWESAPAVKTASGVKKVVVNHTEYATYWNYGHRITNKKGGPTKGFVKGTYVLEKGVTYIDRRLMELFKAEIERIRREHDG